MYGSDWGSRKLRMDWIAFGILFVIVSSILCVFAKISLLIYFPLLFLSVLIAYVVSHAALRWFERTVGRRARYGRKARAYRLW